MSISPRSSQAMELLANSAMMTLTEKFTSAMGERNYEQATGYLAALLLMSSALTLMKDAAHAPAQDEIVLLAVTALQLEVDVMTEKMGGS